MTDGTERMADQAKTRASVEPTLSAKVIALEIMVAAYKEFNGIFYLLDKYSDVLYQCCLQASHLN